MTITTFVRLIISLLILLFTTILLINIFIDPLKTNSIKTFFNKDLLDDLDSRTRTLNFISKNKFSYDNLIIGTSRSMFLNTKENTANISLPSLGIKDYDSLINIFKKNNNKNLKNIVIGIDIEQNFSFLTKSIKSDLKEINKSLFLIERYTSFNYLKSSFNQISFNLFRSENKPYLYYKERDILGQKRVLNLTKFQENKNFQDNLDLINDLDYLFIDQSNKNLKYLKILKNNNPNTNIIIVINPYKESILNQFKLLSYEKVINDYISALNKEFTTYNFLNDYPNIENYYNKNHFTNEIGDNIMSKIKGL